MENDGGDDGVEDGGHTITYSRDFPETPVTVVDGQSGSGTDGYWARGLGTHNSNQHITSAEEEDQVSDSERSHTDDYFGYIAFESQFDIGDFCDARGPENKCIMNESRSLEPERYNVSSGFISQKSARIDSTKGLATLNIDNSTHISGVWTGSFFFDTESPVIRSGASFRPQGGRITIG